MANLEQLELLKQSVTDWNTWKRKKAIELDLRGNLRGADLRGANLIGADLVDANLSNADLRGADLTNAVLITATLNGACLMEAQLRGALLRAARLNDANLSGAYLMEVNLMQAHLVKTDLSGAVMAWTTIAYVDLREVKGLAEIRHEGPSWIALHSVQLPQDGTALHFLRGAGVPDEWIDFWRATVMHPVQYHSLFISYSSKDEMLARRLYADLQVHGVRCWFAPEDMKTGDRIRDRIDKAIHLQDKLLVVLSKHSVASDWVADEVEAAIEKEQRQKREVLFPVRLDASVMRTTTAWAAKLRRTRHIGDFTNWTDPQAYQQAFERLLRDLKQD